MSTTTIGYSYNFFGWSKNEEQSRNKGKRDSKSKQSASNNKKPLGTEVGVFYPIKDRGYNQNTQ